MARPEIQTLYKELVSSHLNILPAGEYQLDEVYAVARKNYPALCDDSYLCRDNCGGGQQQPEWKHTVRKALHRLKALEDVERGNSRGRWIVRGSEDDSH